MFGLTPIFFLASTLVYAAPVPRAALDAPTLLKNGQTAQNLNAQFQNISASDSCQTDSIGCIAGDLANCVDSKWQTQGCPNSLSCFVVPLLSRPGINVTCTSEKNALSTIQATGASGEIAVAGADQHTSNTTDPDTEAADSGDDTCDPDTDDEDSGDDTCEPEDGQNDDDNGDDTCESDGDASASSGASTTPVATSTSRPAAQKTKTVTATPPADAGVATVTVTVTPSTAAPLTTVSVTALPSSVASQATTTVLSGAAASSLLSLLSAQGGDFSTTIVGSPSATSRPVIQLTKPAAAPTPSAADNAGASSSSASRLIIQLTQPAAAPTAANNADASPAATANPFSFSDY
ncbi:hypothetical protein B0H17DRAFT_1328571 [Mycena rosella]|uniref:Carbohydrate-binding module family 19 domain-containing protein n=1 Tax=Mycena rosella TaxID=1033263 RepID=A0AAD7DSI9_MYCRO|nr:hypothetical protein B0H17DRAFT_1328571 [Mycena rosella]